MTRGLALRRETLTELSPAELSDVAGGHSDACVTYTIVPTGCVCSGIWPSLNVDCTLTDPRG